MELPTFTDLERDTVTGGPCGIVRLAFLAHVEQVDIRQVIHTILLAHRDTAGLPFHGRQISHREAVLLDALQSKTAAAQMAYKGICDLSYVAAPEDVLEVAKVIATATQRPDPANQLPVWLRTVPHPASLFDLAAVWATTPLAFDAVGVWWLSGPERFTIKCLETGARVFGTACDMRQDVAARAAAEMTAQYNVTN